MAAATAAIWFGEGIIRLLAKFQLLGKDKKKESQPKETSSMNFNDIELRLRYPHIFREQEYPPEAPQIKVGLAVRTAARKFFALKWLSAFFL